MEPEWGTPYRIGGEIKFWNGGDPMLASSWGPEPSEQPPVSSKGSQVPLSAIREPTPAEARISASGANRVTGKALAPLFDAMRIGGQIPTFGFGDEAVGAVAALGALKPGGRSPSEAYVAARDAERQQIGDLWETSPGASRASTVAGLLGGVLVPGAGLSAPVIAGKGTLASGGGLLRAGGKGVAVGAGQAGLFGLGMAEGDPIEQATAAAKLMPIGGAVGGALAGAPLVWNAIRSSRAGQGRRFADYLVKGADVDDDINSVLRVIRTEEGKLRDIHYSEFDKLPKVARQELERTGLPQKVLDKLPKRSVTFKELQNARTSLRKGFDRDEAELLDQFMHARYKGSDVADAGWAELQQVRRDLSAGKKLLRKGGAEIEDAIGSLPPERAANVRQGMVVEAVRLLDNGSPAMLKRMFRGSVRPEGSAVRSTLPDPVRALRQMFPTDAAFNEFRTIIMRESNAAHIRDAFRRLAGPLAWVIGSMGLGAGYGFYLAARTLQ
jgi:hypothetical protein